MVASWTATPLAILPFVQEARSFDRAKSDRYNEESIGRETPIHRLASTKTAMLAVPFRREPPQYHS